MKTSILIASSRDLNSVAVTGISPPNKKVELDTPEKFTGGDEDDFDLPLNDDLDNFNDLGFDEDDDDF